MVSVTDQHNCSDSKPGLVVTVGTVQPAVEWGLSISPNPSNGLFEIKLANTHEHALQFDLFDGTGYLLRSFIIVFRAAHFAE